MNPGHPQIVSCPFCGTEKELLSLRSGNTFGARYWSDNKQDAPMLPQVSYVQKCHKCGKYYILARQKVKYADDGWSFELGNLNYLETVEAFNQLNTEGFNDLNEECNVRLLMLHTYNDCFFREETSNRPTEHDKHFMCENILWLIDNWAQDEILKAELYREAGIFDKSLEILNCVNVADDFLVKIKTEIIKRAHNNDSMVFEITNI